MIFNLKKKSLYDFEEGFYNLINPLKYEHKDLEESSYISLVLISRDYLVGRNSTC